MSKVVPIDFEYRGTNEFKLDLICASFVHRGMTKQLWLYNDDEMKANLKKHILQMRDEGCVFLAWNVLAEGHAFISLGVDPTKCQWIDLQVEWKMLTNHYHKFMYGQQYMNGKVITTTPPKYGTDKTGSHAKAKTNLAAGIYGLLGVIIDTDHKDYMRNICIHGNSDQLATHRKNIMSYCTSDIQYLVEGFEKAKSEIRDYFKDHKEKEKPTRAEMLYRGISAARTALVQATGYPLDIDSTRNFANSVKPLLKDLAEDINSKLDSPIFKWEKADDRYSMFQAPIKEWIANSEYVDKWKRTNPSKTKPKGDFSLALDAWEKHFSYSHDYPDSMPGQVLRYLKTRRSLNGFLPKTENAKNKETIFDSIGSDGRCRAYLNPYGSQSSRYQPKATSFIPLKAAWMRSLIMPRKGRAIVGIDYSSQEFLISAYMSKDQNMIDAYRSGDVYLYFAKLAGAVPLDGKKEDYKEMRDLFKATTLGISYSMGEAALARKLSADTGRKVELTEAQGLIRKFNTSFPDYARYVDSVRYTYGIKRHWKLADGWVMFGDNDNERSVSNMPVQGMAACILRKAIELCQESGLKVIYPLHDALYIEYDSNDLSSVDKVHNCMVVAFGYFFDRKEDIMKDIRLDIDIWSPDYVNCNMTTPKGFICKAQSRYIDPRSVNEYKKFKKYMEGSV